MAELPSYRLDPRHLWNLAERRTGGTRQRGRRTRTWTIDALAIIALLVAVNLSVGLILDGWQTAAVQLLAAAGAVWWARWRGYSWKELGLAREDTAPGLRLGFLTATAIALSIALVATIPATSGSFQDDRFLDLTAAQVVWELGLRIPFVTAMTEELLFRSVLLGVLLVGLAPWRAVAASSFLFGLWHVLTTLGDLDGNDVTDGFSGWEVVGGVLGVVAITAGAGIGFAWLRLRSGSVLAPWLAHTAINASAFLQASSSHPDTPTLPVRCVHLPGGRRQRRRCAADSAHGRGQRDSLHGHAWRIFEGGVLPRGPAAECTRAAQRTAAGRHGHP